MIFTFKKKDKFPKIINPRVVQIGLDSKFAENTFIHADGEFIKIGSKCSFELGAYLRLWGGRIDIGNNVFLGPYSVIYGHGGVVIGNDVLIASHVTIIPSNHIFSDTNKPISQQGETSLGITIKDGAWIATGAVILDGVVIGKNSVIGAGAVVTKNVPDFAVVGGVPAKILFNKTN